jgi:MHS family proline/betaine transporter-like MFS transporter
MQSASKGKLIAASLIGNVLEWYDFAIYGYFAAAIGRHFFPSEDSVAQLLSAFAVFALGYLVRPIGGALIGHIGDTYGRRAALTISVTAMAVPTFLMGLLPGYDRLGLAAPVILVILRMIQGLSVGGEYTSSMVFLVEHAAAGRRGFMGAITCCGTTIGILLGSGVGAATAALMTPETLEAWGWRIPFLLGIIVGIAGFVLRRHVTDNTPAERGERSPFVETVREHWRLVVRLAGLSMFNGVVFYIMFVYAASWIQTADGIAPAHALAINTLSMSVLLPALLVSGWTSDRFGRKPVLLLSAILTAFAALPLFWVMHHSTPALILLGQSGFGLMVGLYCGAQATAMVELAPSRIRCTAVALGYNVCLGVFGGLSPLVATWLVERTDDQLAPAYLIIAAAIVSFVAALGMPETYRKPLA